MFVFSHFLQKFGLKIIFFKKFCDFFAFWNYFRVKLVNVDLSINIDLLLLLRLIVAQEGCFLWL